ncbi:helix-turn-helix domain-containing protein [Tunicatimonas pelagia]|uniref:helix-turn-helix domain-containing protein n=1 Tax=Tunicatimonas pelagia TaxID=931531 RepID=UPI002664E4C3|nr:helix-turn-helix transcriptional regulator [Tunicatimonas pelagia]WKN40732.1 helix-turn-helix transcriptional regulator [Tunicatimonas pelagia]
MTQPDFFMEKTLLMHVSEKIRKIREVKGFSQDYMASQLNMTQTNYSKIERGDTKEMTVDRLEKIAKVLEVAPGDILNFDENQVFNSTFNNHGGNIMIMKDSFEQMKAQYEARIKELKEEVAFLREMCKGKK